MDVLTWGALIVAGGSIVAVITFWMNLGSRLATSEAKAAASEALAAAALAETKSLTSQVADHRERVARDVAVIKTLADVNTTTLAAAENRMSKSMEDIVERLDKLTERLDRWLEREK